MTCSWHHSPCYDIIGFPYIRRHAWPIKDQLTYFTWGLGFTSVLSSTAGYSCTRGLTRRHAPFLEPTSFNCTWLGCYYCTHPLCVDALEHTDTSRKHNLEYSTLRPHRTDLLLAGAREHYSICTSLHLRKRTATGVTHHPPAWRTSHMYNVCYYKGWAQMCCGLTMS